MKVELKHVHTVKKRLADGTIKLYYRHRLSGTPIKGEPGTLAFQASYEEACAVARAKTEIFKAFIDDFFASQKFAKLSPRTQEDYRKCREIVEPQWGGLPIDVLKDSRVKGEFRKWRDSLVQAKGAKQADLIFGLARRIITFKVKEDGSLPFNHLLDIECAYEADRSDIIWLPEHVEAFMASANEGMQIALILALNLGRREGDLIRLIWGDYRGDVIMVTNRKGGRAIKFPAMVTSSLRMALEVYKASLSFAPLGTRTILTQPRAGTPWPDRQFSNKFSKAKSDAGLTDLHFHDLRGTAVTVLAEEGCTDMQIAAITGHSLKQVNAILDKYLAGTRALNVAATKKLEQTWIAKIRMKI